MVQYLKIYGARKKIAIPRDLDRTRLRSFKNKNSHRATFGIISPRSSGFEHKIYILRQSSKSFQPGFIVL